MTSGDATPGSPASHFEQAIRAHFVIDRARAGVVACSVALFAAGLVVLSPSPALALTIGLWCGYCLSFAMMAIAVRIRPVALIRNAIIVLLVTIPIGAIAGRAIELTWWVGEGLGPAQQTSRFALHLAFVGALIAIPVVQAGAAARRVARAEAERTRLSAHLMMLQAQIEPHFLFNTLATLRSLIRRDAVVAGELLDRMTVFLRAVLPDTRQTNSTLAREMAIVESYLSIMQMRLGERLGYSIAAAPETLRACLPPLLLQPLVENAIKHGVERCETGGTVDIRSAIHDGFLIVEVNNTGEPLKGDAPASGDVGDPKRTGLVNVRSRLAALYPSIGGLWLATAADGATVATLRIPLSRA